MIAPSTILENLWRAGLTVSLLGGGKLLVSPAGLIHDEQREMLIVNKPAIIDFLREADDLSSNLMARLLEGAMRRCDEFGDGLAARAAMEHDCRRTPPHLRQDLLDHFTAARVRIHTQKRVS